MRTQRLSVFTELIACGATCWIAVLVVGLCFSAFGCGLWELSADSDSRGFEIPQASTMQALLSGVVYDASGRKLTIRELSNKKHLLILITRGIKLPVDLDGTDCQSCIGQSAEFANHGQEFNELDCEVVIVVPTLSDGPQTIQKFRRVLAVNRGKPADLRICYDLKFNWSKRLGIVMGDDYAHRSAFLLDQNLQLVKVNITSNLLEFWNAIDFTQRLQALDVDS